MSQAVLTDVAKSPHLNDAELKGVIDVLGADRLCPNCNRLMTGEAMWCQPCGFYRSLGTFVETQEENSSSVAVEAAYTRDWIHCAVGSSALIVLVTVASVTARFATEPYSGERFWYSVAQIGVGLLLALSAHVAAWIWGLLNTNDIKICDVVVNPIDVWRVTVEELPRSWRRLSIGAAGLLAVILGVTVVEGVTMAHVIGNRAIPKQPKLLNSLVAQANAAGQAQAEDQPQPQTLEEAIEQFAGQGEEITGDLDAAPDDSLAFNPWGDKAKTNAADDEKADEKPVDSAPAATPDVTVKCVVVGYTQNEDGRINEVIVAAIHRGRLTWAATVSDGVKERMSLSLARQISGLTQPLPSIKCPIGERKIVWVRPKATCEINCVGVRTSGELVGPVFGGP